MEREKCEFANDANKPMRIRVIRPFAAFALKTFPLCEIYPRHARGGDGVRVRMVKSIRIKLRSKEWNNRLVHLLSKKV